MHSMVGPSRGNCVLASCDCAKYEAKKPVTKKKK
jgi:hypothetical protein